MVTQLAKLSRGLFPSSSQTTGASVGCLGFHFGFGDASDCSLAWGEKCRHNWMALPDPPVLIALSILRHGFHRAWGRCDNTITLKGGRRPST